MPLLGAHMSISGGLYKALYRGKEVGCQAIQIFSKNRNQWKAKMLAADDVDAFHKAREETGVNPVAVHCSYLVNLASPRSDVVENSFHALLDELERTERLRIPYLVMHPGAHLGSGEGKGIRRIARGIDRLLARSRIQQVKILLETTAGQGTAIGSRFEHFAEIFEMIEHKERLGICFDTCHLFAAGLDFRDEQAYRQLLEKFDMLIGIEHLKLFHVNDSKRAFGSMIDRHEHLGLGLIGMDSFRLFLNDSRFGRHAFLLETPKGKNEDGLDWDIRNLNILKKLIRKNEPDDCF